MTPEAQRIAIAETCGWTFKIVSGQKYWQDPCRTREDDGFNPPDYLNDLNAMHEAEKVLTTQQCWEYTRKLQELQGTAGGIGSGVACEWTWHATAAQRAQAWLRAKNLWKD